jgi:thioredoxin 1
MSSEKITRVTNVTNIDDIPKTGNVVIDFYATWCKPCQMLTPVFSDLSNKYDTITFLKIDVDESQSISEHYEVSALPSVIFIKDGEVISMIKGFNYDMLINQLDDLSK